MWQMGLIFDIRVLMLMTERQMSKITNDGFRLTRA